MMSTDTTQFVSEAQVVVATPQRYLGQLCKHFQHKAPASWGEGYRTGRIDFPMGTCTLAADDDAGRLIMTATAATIEDLARVENVIARHLERFAFRETLATMWARQDPAA